MPDVSVPVLQDRQKLVSPIFHEHDAGYATALTASLPIAMMDWAELKISDREVTPFGQVRVLHEFLTNNRAHID